MTETKKSWLLMAALWLLLLVLAALRPMAVPDEGRYGEIGRWMWQSGDWLTQRLNGLPFFHKPPLLYWLEGALVGLLGAHVWVLRLAPALHAGLMLVVLYLSARSFSTEAVARRAVLMLGTSLSFLIGGQYINHDMMVATWIGVAIWCFALSFMHGERPHAALARLGYIACALGILSKGLIGLALPGLVLLVWLIWTRQLRKLLYLPWLSGLAMFGAIAVPWFVLAEREHPGMLNYLFGTQQFTRYTASSFNNAQPWWFYPVALVLLMFPWVFFALRKAWDGVRGPQQPDAPSAWVALCWIWLLAIVGFFSIPTSKLIGYILPVMPPLALLSAWGWQRAMGQCRAARAVFGALAAVAVALAAGGTLLAERYTQHKLTGDIAATLACAASPQDTIYAVDGFPYDLPFLLQTAKPLVVIQDWPTVRAKTGDNWRRELFEGADFEPETGKVLQNPEALQAAATQPGQWLVAPRAYDVAGAHPGWVQVQKGTGWSLYRSAPERPKAAEHKGLAGCRHQSGK